MERIYVYAVTVTSNEGKVKTYYEAVQEPLDGTVYGRDQSLSELATRMGAVIGAKGKRALIVFRQPFDACITGEGKLRTKKGIQKERYGFLTEKEQEEFLAALR
jgi:hypothetical protein